ncbi:unnamed protein product, partial [Rotaria sp. Silwood1]
EQWVCDHVYDCGREDRLASRTCPNGYFKCSAHRCINNTGRCNGNAQCRDGSDEADCQRRYPNGQHCPIDHFTCNNALCLNKNWVCDGNNDYLDKRYDATLELSQIVPCNSTNRFQY